MDRLTKINELKISIDKEIKQRGMPQSKIDLLSNLQTRLLNIENILLIKKYDLVFIGQVGVGKTTAICHLFQLVMESKKKNKIGNREEDIEVIEELMATGAGFTTPCEVVIKQDSSTFIEIEPYSTEEVRNIINDFCWPIWQNIYPDLDKYSKDKKILSPELTRAVRNLVNFPPNPKDSNEKEPAIKLASNFDKSSFKEFSTEVYNRANMADRNEVKIFPKNGESNLKSWLKLTFNNLNLGKISSFSIPHKINLHIQPSIISVEYDRIDSIVDTKGLDVGQFNRQDLDTYIRHRNNSICFFTENFSSAPSNVIEIIQRHMTKEARDISTKIILFVIPRENQPEKVVGQDGAVGDRKEGISMRLNQIQDGFDSRGISFPKENILFYDPLEYYEAVDVDHRKLQDFEQNDIDNERKRIFAEIERIVQQRENLVWGGVQEIENLLIEQKKVIRKTHPLEAKRKRENKKLKCIVCHKDFIFTTGERKFFEKMGYKAPIRCEYCRKLKRLGLMSRH